MTNNNNEHNKAEQFYNGQAEADKKEAFDPYAEYWVPGQTKLPVMTTETMRDLKRAIYNLG